MVRATRVGRSGCRFHLSVMAVLAVGVLLTGGAYASNPDGCTHIEPRYNSGSDVWGLGEAVHFWAYCDPCSENCDLEFTDDGGLSNHSFATGAAFINSVVETAAWEFLEADCSQHGNPDSEYLVVDVEYFKVNGEVVAAGGTRYFAKAATGNVTIEACLSYGASAEEVRSEFVDWTGGSAGATQLLRTVSKTTAASTTLTCEVDAPGATPKSVTIKVVEVTDLTVSGATEGAPAGTYYAAIAATGDVTLTATLNPSVAAGDLPDGIVTWEGGTTGANKLERKVTKTAAASTTVTATCGTSDESATIKVVEVTALDVSGATEGTPAGTYYAAIAAEGDVVLTATLNPAVAAGDLPNGIVTWEGGTTGANKLERKVTKTAAAPTTVTATCGTSDESATIKVVEVTALGVSGATEGTPEGTYYAAIAATGDVTLTATLNPSVAAGDLPDGIVTWEGGTTGANKLQRKVTKTAAASTTVTATCGTSDESATIKVVEVTDLTVSGATEWGSTTPKTYATGQLAAANVTITAVVNPVVTAANLPAGIVVWTNGTEGANKLQRLVSKAAVTDVTVTATCGTSSEAARIVVRRVDGANATVTPTENPTVDNNAASNRCLPALEALTWHATYDSAGDKWYVRVDTLTLTGQIDIKPWTNNPNTMTVPNTSNPVDGGNINNTPASNNLWSYAKSDMADYDTDPGGGAGPHWHSTAASSAHEWYHWNTDYVETCVLGATKGNWPGTETAMEGYNVAGATYLKEADAIAALTAQVTARLTTFQSAVTSCWNNDIIPKDEPGKGGGGYAAGAASLAPRIAAIETYRTNKGW